MASSRESPVPEMVAGKPARGGESSPELSQTRLHGPLLLKEDLGPDSLTKQDAVREGLARGTRRVRPCAISAAEQEGNTSNTVPVAPDWGVNT